MTENPRQQPQRPKRSPVFFAASLQVGPLSLDVRLRNLSEGGAMIESDELPLPGSEVVVRRKDNRMGGRVAWVAGSHAGIQFECAVKPAELINPVKVPSTDARPAVDYRRPGVRSHQLTPCERRWAAALMDRIGPKP
jgi:hypothetical protein